MRTLIRFFVPAIVLSLLALFVAVIALARAWADHTFYKRRIRELQRRTLEAQQMLKQRGDLANEIAHEIKNPITAILCSAETLDLLIGESLEEVHRKSLCFIKEYGDNLLRLVSDFLDVSRAETGNIQAKPEQVEIRPMVDSIVGLLASNSIKRHITVKTFISDELPVGFVDPTHIKQIVFNLLHNAIKFTPLEGEIHVEVKSGFPEPFIKMAIKDNGDGIADDQLDTLFDPYAKGSGNAPSNDTGTGLGLALVKLLVELAGGAIEVQSKLGVGTTFNFTIPRYLPEHDIYYEEDGEIDESVSHPFKGQRFLIVDEDLGSRESMARLIEAWGGMVDRVSLAVDAVDALSKREYTTILIDDTVDGIYGYELARMIRDDFGIDQTSIVIATNNPLDAKLIRDAGADRCVAKPLNGKALLHSLLRSGKYHVTH